jgi:YVTN family beta-propeller protein
VRQKLAILYTLIAFIFLMTRGETSAADSTVAKSSAAEKRAVPVALDITNNGTQLLVSCRNGTVKRVQIDSREVIETVNVSQQLSAAKLHIAQRAYAVLDTENNFLVRLEVVDGKLKQMAKIAVPAKPVDLVWSQDGKRCLVASNWARQITAIQWNGNSSAKSAATVELPFAPGKLILLPDQRNVAVADAFGNGMAVFDWQELKLKRIAKIDGHNISDLAISFDKKTLLLTHQVLYYDKGTTRPAVHWGGVLANVVEGIDLESLLSDGNNSLTGNNSPTGNKEIFGNKERLTVPGKVYFLGIPDEAAGDPAGLVETSDERRIVVYSGVNQVAISDRGVNFYNRIGVGKRPTKIALSANEERAYVCNSFSDSISVLQVNPAKVLATIPLTGQTVEPTASERGEELFFNSKLAQDGWFSCHSCHTNGHTNHQLNDNLGDDSFGAPKRVPSLLGVSKTAPWTWRGTSNSLHQQIAKSVELTMRGKPVDKLQQDDIVAYLKTLLPPMSVHAARSFHSRRATIDPVAVRKGRSIFRKSGCVDCHSLPNYTSADSYDVGLKDELGNTKFNPPSLLGVSQRDNLFHDGRAGSLKEVLKEFRHGQDRELSDEQIEALIQFLMRI